MSFGTGGGNPMAEGLSCPTVDAVTGCSSVPTKATPVVGGGPLKRAVPT